MEPLTTIFDPTSIIAFSVALLTFCILFYIALAKQKIALSKVNESLKLQSQANHQLNLMVRELRRSNRLLSELAELEVEEDQPEMDKSNNDVQENNNTVSSQFKLYVGNIDYTATEAELAEHFEPYGQIESVNIPVNRYNGKARGFGFVTFISRDDAEKAMALHGSEFKGRQIQVNFAKEREV